MFFVLFGVLIALQTAGAQPTPSVPPRNLPQDILVAPPVAPINASTLYPRLGEARVTVDPQPDSPTAIVHLVLVFTNTNAPASIVAELKHWESITCSVAVRSPEAKSFSLLGSIDVSNVGRGPVLWTSDPMVTSDTSPRPIPGYQPTPVPLFIRPTPTPLAVIRGQHLEARSVCTMYQGPGISYRSVFHYATQIQTVVIPPQPIAAASPAAPPGARAPRAAPSTIPRR